MEGEVWGIEGTCRRFRGRAGLGVGRGVHGYNAGREGFLFVCSFYNIGFHLIVIVSLIIVYHCV